MDDLDFIEIRINQRSASSTAGDNSVRGDKGAKFATSTWPVEFKRHWLKTGAKA